MSNPEPVSTEQRDAAKTRRRRLGPVGAAIAPRLTALQEAYLAGSPAARAQLAQLRRGLARAPGDVPEIWDLCVGGLPAELTWERDEPTRAEAASHAALTLYATHQQAFTGRAHQSGASFGAAVARLRDGSSRGDAVTRRFMAVATSQTADELLVHVRGLVTQLRAAQIGMDYAIFADDVAALLDPYRKSSTRLRWGRDYYRRVAQDASTDDKQTRSDDEDRTTP